VYRSELTLVEEAEHLLKDVSGKQYSAKLVLQEMPII
jgi:hypothetical protein